MSKEQKVDLRTPEPGHAPQPKGHGFDGPVRSKVKGGLHTKAALKRTGVPVGDRIGERTKGLS
ncbi:hypothetical protein AB0953_11050 [Streptomyces sp. NPDC046866]|uniref:hypothetical protein n=1 Tax=Streptomyces sp. NPDC046866 TaxID=3154921 RepID=UPI003454D257